MISRARPKWHNPLRDFPIGDLFLDTNLSLAKDAGDDALACSLESVPDRVLARNAPSPSSTPSSSASRCRGLCLVTSIVECPDVARSEEWRSGVTQLAVSSSRGDIVLLKI